MHMCLTRRALGTRRDWRLAQTPVTSHVPAFGTQSIARRRSRSDTPASSDRAENSH